MPKSRQVLERENLAPVHSSGKSGTGIPRHENQVRAAHSYVGENRAGNSAETDQTWEMKIPQQRERIELCCSESRGIARGLIRIKKGQIKNLEQKNR
jgi:hypothetical protein